MPSSQALAPPGRWPRAERALLVLVLAVPLVLSCLLGFATTYVLLVAAMVVAVLLLLQPGVDWTPDPLGRVLLIAFVVLLALFTLTANDPLDPLAAFNFIAFPLYLPLVVLLRRHAGVGNARRVAELALWGAGLGFALSALEVYLFNTGRAGVAVTDPIRLANTAVILGFLAPVMAIPHASDPKRWLHLLGPLFALLTVLLTGARIAMIALPVLAFVAMFLIIRRKWIAFALAALVVALLLAAGLTNIFGSARLALLLESVGDVMAGGVVGDEAVRIRLVLYEAGRQAFLQSPLIGHGFSNMMEAVTPFLPEADKVHATLPHLHNEFLNFAVSGGVVGIALCAALLAAPVVIAWWSPRNSQYRARRNGAIVLAASYAVMGLTDTMLSFELHTALYVGLTAILFGYCRDPATASRGDA